jgi:hypothetical protein
MVLFLAAPAQEAKSWLREQTGKIAGALERPLSGVERGAASAG